MPFKMHILTKFAKLVHRLSNLEVPVFFMIFGVTCLSVYYFKCLTGASVPCIYKGVSEFSYTICVHRTFLVLFCWDKSIPKGYMYIFL